AILKGDTGRVKDLLKSGNTDPDEFSRFLWSSHIAGTMYSILSSSDMGALFPASLTERLKSSYLEQWAKNEKLLRETQRLRELFESGTVDVIFLKGAFLAARYYGDIDRRAISDIDLLIRKEGLRHADRILRGAGYLRKSHAFPSEALAAVFTHHFEYGKNGIDLDLHWNLSTHFTFKIDYIRLWRESRLFSYRGRSYPVLSDEYELVFQILSIFKDIELGTIKLKSFVDVYMIMRAAYGETRWPEFFERRSSEGIFNISLNVLDLVFRLFELSEEFPRAAEYLDRNRDYVTITDPEELAGLITRIGFSMQNKRWALAQYSAGSVYSLLWWITSLPFKLQVYRHKGPGVFKGGKD
ncbi:MAG TPA: nucleotidyltransferase family protein, partial [Thermodesulfobacteriota bacterium]|nr:nucleotidyltransferase family protein [Thermodesulfobacteriota bacterium]